MAALTTQAVALPSLLSQFTPAAAGGDTATPGQNTWLEVNNGSGASINVTIDVPGNDDFGNARPDLVVPVAAATERKIPLRASQFVQTTGQVNITYSAVTTVTVGVFST